MSEEKYIPKSKLGQWFDSRLPLLTLSHHLQSYPTPKNLNYWWTFGGILTFCLITQIITGLVLAMHYVAHVDYAFQSIEHIMRDVNYGWLIRYVHANGASMFFLAVYIHIFRSLFYGSYKAPREVIWIIGLLIYILMMATAFMGYVLPWGQMSFWGATVITNLFSAIPFVGESITTWLWGGYSVDNPTLNRFYSLHYLLPFLIFGLVVLHIWALHVPGNNNPTGIDVKKNSNETMPFHPYMVMKDLLALLLFIIVFLWFVFFAPNVLGHPDNYIEANPLVTPAHIVPEWYLLPFYAILRAIPSKLGGVIFMFSAIFILMLLPWLDTSKVRSAIFRPIYKKFFWLLVFVVILLGYLGAKPPEGIYLVLSRLATAYYFIHFLLILPLLGRYEKTDPLPQSISDPVLTKAGMIDKFKKAAAEYEGENVESFK
jgi:ubiquinol-cytochrome c reductase cytochrome b/c1 subunit